MRRSGWYKKCEECGKKRWVTPALIKIGRGKYCSRSCASKHVVYKMHKARGESWKKNVSRGIRRLYSTMHESDHPRWAGENVGYWGIHDWLTKHYGQPKKCEVCGLDSKNKMYHWANITGLHKRSRKSYKRMCVSCHRKHDYKQRKNA